MLAVLMLSLYMLTSGLLNIYKYIRSLKAMCQTAQNPSTI